MDQIGNTQAPVCGSGGLPDTLAWAFDAFETIRSVARDCEDRAPQLFATFMMAAGVAVEGRNALADAPSFPVGGSGAPEGVPPKGAPPEGTDVERIADELSALAEVLADRLSQAAAVARLPGDRFACENATESAHGIGRLLARASDETAAR